MDLGPGFNEALLSPGEGATDTLDGIEREYRLGILIHSMEVWPMVWCIDFHEHSDDDSEEPRQLRHVVTLHRPATCCLATGALSRGGTASAFTSRRSPPPAPARGYAPFLDWR